MKLGTRTALYLAAGLVIFVACLTAFWAFFVWLGSLPGAGIPPQD